MKFLHLSDLHIGKKVDGFSMIEDQTHILNEIVKIADEENPEAIVISGDIYDRTDPSAEAVTLFDYFLTLIGKRKIPLFIINGNHDSAERIAYANNILEFSQIYISPVFDGKIKKVTLTDEIGNVNFYLLPFLKPAYVKKYFPDMDITSYNDAVKAVVDTIDINTVERNVIVAHQFVTGALRSDSEDISVGGLDNIEVSVFESFDYAALGHIHRPQRVGRDTVRYCGTPLKYSLSESNDEKSVTVVQLEEKGNITLREIPLSPLHNLREIRGTYDEIMNKSNYDGTAVDDYIHVTLTDEEDVVDAIRKMRTVYPNIMKLRYDNKRTSDNQIITSSLPSENKTTAEIFEELYIKQNNCAMTDEQRKIIDGLVEEIEEVK